MGRLERLRAVPAPEPSLEELLLSAGRGDQEAFTRFYGAVLAQVHRVALRTVRDPALAEDIAQEALVEAWRQAPRYDPSRASAKAWVLTLAHRRAVDRVRREQRQRDQIEAEAAEAPAPHAPDPQDDVAEADYRAWQSARVRDAMGMLTPLQREAVELTYYGGRTHAEVSEHLGIPLGTAKTRIRDALRRLRTTLEEAST